jgi:hypothetical protein
MCGAFCAHVLKISIFETPTEERWILCGRLTAPWVRELRTSWKKNHRAIDGHPCIVDLAEVTLIDRSGERCLRIMMKQGAEFIAGGVYTRLVLERLIARRNHPLAGPFFGLFAFLLIARPAVGVPLSFTAAKTAQIEAPSLFSPTTQQLFAQLQTQLCFDRSHAGGNNAN